MQPQDWARLAFCDAGRAQAQKAGGGGTGASGSKRVTLSALVSWSASMQTKQWGHYRDSRPQSGATSCELSMVFIFTDLPEGESHHAHALSYFSILNIQCFLSLQA